MDEHKNKADNYVTQSDFILSYFLPNSKINQFFQNYGFYKIFNSKAVKLK
jgi:hypothetical protein